MLKKANKNIIFFNTMSNVQVLRRPQFPASCKRSDFQSCSNNIPRYITECYKPVQFREWSATIQQKYFYLEKRIKRYLFRLNTCYLDCYERN